MNLWLRLLATIFGAWRGPPIEPPFGVSSLTFRVWPHDLDISLHMNNGRYFGIMDLGRLDLIFRMGLWRAVLKHRWTPILDAAIVRYRRELRLFKSFRVETRILCWRAASIMIEQRILAVGRDGKEILHAIALHRVGLYDRRAKTFITTERLMEEVGIHAVSPPPKEAIAAFFAAEEALRRSI